MKLLSACITCILLMMLVPAQAQQEQVAPPDTTQPVEVQQQTEPTPPSPAVQITEQRIGSGAEASAGARIGVHYTGWLYDAKAIKMHGKKFDSSYDRHRPIFLVLGEHRVIQGWEQGLLGMKVGGKRTLVIPPALAYGATGVAGLIPPDATLIFDVELVAVN